MEHATEQHCLRPNATGEEEECVVAALPEMQVGGALDHVYKARREERERSYEGQCGHPINAYSALRTVAVSC
jgi:hypothetical protein